LHADTFFEHLFYSSGMRAGDGTGQRGKVSPRHVWVKFGSLASPGVLLDWRRGRNGWEAYVMYATGGGTSSVTVTAQWVPAAHVMPLEQ
jgi:hypothetical protein